MANNIVTSTINIVKFKIDSASFNKSRKAIKSLRQQWEGASTSFTRAQEKAARAQQAAINKQAKAEAAQRRAQRTAASEALKIEKRTQAIRAKGIRFSTASNGYNLTPRQRAEAISDFARLTKQYHSGSLALGEYNARVSKLQQRMRQQGGLVKKPVNLPVTARVTKLDTSMIDGAGGVITIAATIGLGKSIMEVGQNFESAQNGLTAVMGSAEKAASEFQYLRDESNRLGLDLIQTSKDYTRFAASANGKISTSQIHTLFEGISEYGVTLGATADEQSMAMRSIQQMLSKGQIMSEELKGQLAEALPGAVGIFTKALQKMRKDTTLTDADLFQLMKDGQLMAADILPYVAEEMKATARAGGALDRAVNSNRAAYQRLKTAVQDAGNEFFMSGFGAELTEAFNDITDAINTNKVTFQTLGAVAGGVVDGIVSVFNYLHDSLVIVSYYIKEMMPDFIKNFEGLGKAMGQTAGIAAGVGLLWKLGGALKWLISFAPGLKSLVASMIALSAAGGAGAVIDAATGAKGGKDKTRTPKTGPSKGNIAGAIAAATGIALTTGKDASLQTTANGAVVGGMIGGPLGAIMGALSGAGAVPAMTKLTAPPTFTDEQSNIGALGSWIHEKLAPVFNGFAGVNSIPGVNSTPTFTSPDISGMVPGVGKGMPVYVTGQADIKQVIDVNVNDGAVENLVDAKIRDFETTQINLLAAEPQ